MNGAQDILEKATLGDITSSTTMINSPVMEEVSFVFSLNHIIYIFFYFHNHYLMKKNYFRIILTVLDNIFEHNLDFIVK